MVLLCSAAIAGSKREKNNPQMARSGKHRAELSLACPQSQHPAWACCLDPETQGISLAVLLSPGVTGAVPLALWREDKIEI